MTERKWLSSKDPEAMLAFLAEHIPDEETDGDPMHLPVVRKVRLFAVACCRRVEHLLTDKRSRKALDVMELYLDKRTTKKQYRLATYAASRVTWDYERVVDGRLQAASAVYSTLDDIQDDFADVEEAAGEVVNAVIRAIPETQRGYLKATREAIKAERAVQAHLLREIFGNPFRPVSLDPLWLTFDVQALAQGIYDERAFDRMPILADALQDAGCDNPDVLNHCRDANQIHVRGCWVLDLLLGKG